MADVNVGDNGVLRMEAWVTYSDPAGNYNNYHWKLSLIERTPSVYGYSGSVGASVEIFWDIPNGYHSPWSGSFAFDFRPGGQQSVVIAEGDTNGLGNYGDGSPRSFLFRGNIANTGTSTIGGAASVDQWVTPGYTRVAPVVPSTPVASYVDDTKINLAWTQNGNPSNGQPTSNQVYCKDNNGAEYTLLDISATNSVAVGVAGNHKYEFRVSAWGVGTGFTGKSGWSAPVYTSPASPINVTAVKQGSLDIKVDFSSQVAYSEHTHEVWHGTVSGGVTTWDGAALTTLASGVTTYTHSAPNAAQVHVYRVRARAGALASGFTQSGSVQLLTAPGKPATPAMGATADKAQALVFAWQHNSIDTTGQTAYQFQRSINGGSTWATDSGKVVSAAQQFSVPASTYAGNVALTTRVRTWGSATTGGADGTGASPWSDLRTVTYKTIPTTSITAPANGGSLNDSTVRVTLGFGQVESATFVKAQIQLLQGATLLEELESGNRTGVILATPVANGVSYTVRARVQDSNGLWSAWSTSTFSVVYLSPPAAVTGAIYLPDSGYGQINIQVPAPIGGQSAATTVTLTRTIDGVTETVIEDYPSAALITFLDTTPTIHGTNLYTVITKTALGATKSVTTTMVTEELRRAFLSKGAAFDKSIVFGGNLEVSETLGVATATIEAAGRSKPIGLYGIETNVQLKVKSRIFGGFGSTIDQARALLLLPGKACYRDSSGRRVFGSVKGSVGYQKVDRGDLAFTITETSN